MDLDSTSLELSALQRTMVCIEAGSVCAGSAQAASDLFAQAEQLLKVGAQLLLCASTCMSVRAVVCPIARMLSCVKSLA